MTITLHADDDLIARARVYAEGRGMTLEQLLIDHLQHVAAAAPPDDAAEEFLQITAEHAIRSPDGWRFEREASHQRRAS